MDSPFFRSRLARRNFLRGSAGGALGVGAILVGCGDDDDDDATTTPGGGGSPTASGSPSAVTSPSGSPTADGGQPKAGGTLKLPIIFASGHFDVHQFVIGYQSSLWRAVGNGLVVVNPETGNPDPDLAESWEFEDETTLVMHLNPAATWHDVDPVNGRAVTAEDVKFSFERIATPSADYPRSSDYAPVERFEAVDDHTFRFILKRPYAPLINLLTNHQAIVVPPEVVAQFGDLKDPAAMIGSGPFIAERVDGTTGARLVRNPSYWQEGMPYLDAAEWTIVSDTQTSLSAFRAGDFDLHAIDAIDLSSLEGDDNIVVDHFTAPTYMVAGLGGPIDAAPLDDPRVRQAIDLAIDRQALGQVVYPGGDFQLSTVFGHPVWSIPNDEVMQLPGYRANKEEDLADARALLEAAGHGGGLDLTVSTTPDFPSFHIDRAQVYKAQLAEIGINLEISTDEYAAYKDKERAKRFQLSTGAWGFSGDPDAPLSGAFHTEGARNYFSYSSPDYDALVEKERATFDHEERLQVILDAQRMLLEDRPVAAFNAWFLFQDMGRQSYVKGLRLGGISHSGSNAGDIGYQLKYLWIDS